jgi:hypothetical protein
MIWSRDSVASTWKAFIFYHGVLSQG